MSTPQSNEKHLWVSWDEYHRLIERLADDPDALIVRMHWVVAGWHPPSDDEPGGL